MVMFIGKKPEKPEGWDDPGYRRMRACTNADVVTRIGAIERAERLFSKLLKEADPLKSNKQDIYSAARLKKKIDGLESSMCTGKHRHTSLANAKKQLRPGLTAYKCPICGFYHVGHPVKDGDAMKRTRVFIRKAKKKIRGVL